MLYISGFIITCECVGSHVLFFSVCLDLYVLRVKQTISDIKWKQSKAMRMRMKKKTARVFMCVHGCVCLYAQFLYPNYFLDSLLWARDSNVDSKLGNETVAAIPRWINPEKRNAKEVVSKSTTTTTTTNVNVNKNQRAFFMIFPKTAQKKRIH